MHMVSKKDHDYAELETMRTSMSLETMRTSMSPTTVMTANGEVQTNEEATVCVLQLGLFVKVVLLEETPAVLSMEKLCEDHGYTYHWTSGQKTHLIKNAIYPTMQHLWFLVYRHHRIPYLMSTDAPKNLHQKEVEVRVKSFGKPRCINSQTENKNKNEGREEVQRDISHELLDWLHEFRENSVDESTSTEPWRNPEQGSQDTSKSSHELLVKTTPQKDPFSRCEICKNLVYSMS